MMKNENDLFEKMINDSNSTGMDNSLENPFDDNSNSYTIFDELKEAQSSANKTVTNEKLIDRLPEHRKKQALDLAKQIDESNHNIILTYGANAQKKLSEFSRSILNQVQTKDTGEIGLALNELMTQLNETNPKELTAENNVFKRLFGKVKSSLDEVQMRYQKAGSQIDRIAIRLDREKNELLNDNQMLETYYQKNKEYFDALNIYIAAAEIKMVELQKETIPTALEKAYETNDQMDLQSVNDLNNFLERLDKRCHDLRLTRQMIIQQAPQIRMIQNTNQVLAEKIQSSIHTAIPLWENQITIALAILRQQNAAHSQRIVSDTTNNLLLKNSEMLKQSTLDTAREAERGVIDLETLQMTQNNLIDTLQETLEIQEAGRKQRQLAEAELISMENELRDKLLEISTQQKSSFQNID